EQFQGETCKFSTVYDTELLPLVVEEARLLGRPFATPGANNIRGAGGVLRLQLRSFNEAISINELRPQRLRFYLKGQAQHIYPLYEMLMNESQHIVITFSESVVTHIYTDKHLLKPVGFAEDEVLLPYTTSSMLGYRLLTEFFVLPEKFLFIDIEGLDKYIPA